MKKIKAIFLLVTMALVCAIFATACGGGDVSVVLDKESVTLDVGQSVTINAEVDGTKDSVTWTSANEDVVSVAQDGTVTGIKNGETKVYAEAGGEKAECIISVQEGVLGKPKIKLNCGAVNLYRGYKYAISASFYIGAKEQSVNEGDFIWSSDNETVATVVAGTITAISQGKATIKVSYSYNGETYFDQKEISVNPLAMLLVEAEESTLASSVTYGGNDNSNLTKTNLSITKVDGETVTKLSDFSNVVFASADSDVATANENGEIVSGGKVGTTTITATLTDNSVSFVGSCEIEVRTAISSKYDMDMLALAYARGKVADWAAGNYYLLTNDIDYKNEVYIPIAAAIGRNIDDKTNYIGKQWKTILGDGSKYKLTYEQFKEKGLNQYNWHSINNTWSSWKTYCFSACFDGNGFTISNGQMMFDAMGASTGDGIAFNTGLFGAIGENGILKNVAFKNFSRQNYASAGYTGTMNSSKKTETSWAFDSVTVTATTPTTGSKTCGVYPDRVNCVSLISNIIGTVENVYVKASYMPQVGESASFTAVGIAGFAAFSVLNGKTAKLTNCYFELEDCVRDNNMFAYRVLEGSAVTFNNVVIAGLTTKRSSGASTGIEDAKATVNGSVSMYDTTEALKNAIETGSVTLGSDWVIDKDSGLPVLNIR